MIEDLEAKKLMLHCLIAGLYELGFGGEFIQYIVEKHFLPLTTFKNEYKEITKLSEDLEDEWC